MKQYQAIVVGGGSAGLASAISLKENGINDILVIEKDQELGGILNQCIHNGFGLSTFHEQLSGPMYASRYIDMLEEKGIDYKCNTMVTNLTSDRILTYVNSEEGYVDVQAEAIILSVGCYERNRGALQIPGSRVSGVYTAGQAQKYLNMDGYLVGKRVFILGSGDIGLIMARRMTLEGAEVLGVGELMPYSAGLPRNIAQCLEDFNIPLYLSHTVTHIYGDSRLEKIELTQVDENRQPIDGTQKYFEVDTLLLSCGLLPEDHLAKKAGVTLDPFTKGPIVDQNYMTNIPGIFACGNGLHVHDLVDYVSHQSSIAGKQAAKYILQKRTQEKCIVTIPKENVGYVVPGELYLDNLDTITEFYFRPRKPIAKGKIIVQSGQTIIREITKEHLIPSEMEKVILAKAQLENLQDDLTIRIEEL